MCIIITLLEALSIASSEGKTLSKEEVLLNTGAKLVYLGTRYGLISKWAIQGYHWDGEDILPYI
jgi:hypothetical protein